MATPNVPFTATVAFVYDHAVQEGSLVTKQRTATPRKGLSPAAPSTFVN
jgi:hypothetical protein